MPSKATFAPNEVTGYRRAATRASIGTRRKARSSTGRSCSSSGGNWRCCPPNIGRSHGRLLYPQQSCAEIAHDLRISVEMVKYYLFKTRKIMKEGVEMTREFGEKSYHPGTFQMDFWGGGRQFPLLGVVQKKAARQHRPGRLTDAPLTMQELSMELGWLCAISREEVQLPAAGGNPREKRRSLSDRHRPVHRRL